MPYDPPKPPQGRVSALSPLWTPSDVPGTGTGGLKGTAPSQVLPPGQRGNAGGMALGNRGENGPGLLQCWELLSGGASFQCP